jgi:tripartite-type tricarboxylate transporter receptor subunit TctC
MIYVDRRAVLAGLTAFVATPALAAWPERPITITHGFAPGGGVDTTARILAEHLTRRLGQQVIVEPMPGAASIVAAGHVARSVPDGYTISLFTSTFAAAASLRRNLGFRPIDDFATISLATEFPYVIATNREHPITNFLELINAARSAPQPLLYGTPGQGSAQHLLITKLARELRIRLQHVPFRGGAQALTEVLARRVDLIVDPPLLLSEHIANGTLRPLAVTTKERSSSLPDIPSVSEAGLVTFDVRGWMGVVGPAALPTAIIGRLSSEIAETLADSDVIQRLRSLGSQPRASTPDELRALLASDIGKWTAAIDESGIERL